VGGIMNRGRFRFVDKKPEVLFPKKGKISFLLFNTTALSRENMQKFTVTAEEVFSLDSRSLAIFRIMLGLYLFLDMINRIMLVPSFYSDSGILPRYLVDLDQIEYAWHLHLMMISGTEWFACLFLGLLLLFSLLLMAGYKTRWMTFWCWLLFSSVIIRDPLTRHAADTLVILLLFWGMFLPLDRSWSVDSLLHKKENSQNLNILSAETVGMYVQFLLFYITTGWFKGMHMSWLDGTHLYITFSRFDYAEPLAFLVYPHYELLSFLTHFTLVLELFGPLLFLIPIFFMFFRLAGIFLFIGLQVSIGLTMDVGLFPLVSIAGVLVFLPRQFWEKLTDRMSFEAPGTVKNMGIWLESWLPEKVFSFHLFKPYQKERYKIYSESFLVLVIAYVTLWNVYELSHKDLPDPVKKPGYYLKLDQRWSMFASPVLSAQYLTADALFSDGTEKDIMSDLRVHHNSSDQFHHVGYTNYRWRIFFSNKLGRADHIHIRPYFLRYLSRNFCTEADNENPLKRVQLVAHRHMIGERYDHSPVEPFILYTLDFDDDECDNSFVADKQCTTGSLPVTQKPCKPRSWMKGMNVSSNL
jgi:hypothetical protein